MRHSPLRREESAKNRADRGACPPGMPKGKKLLVGRPGAKGGAKAKALHPPQDGDQHRHGDGGDKGDAHKAHNEVKDKGDACHEERVGQLGGDVGEVVALCAG